jgi:hypothetical protein
MQEVTMRTTLAIDDDVLAAARGMADAQNKTVGEVISDLARQALVPASRGVKTRNGILLMPRRADAPPATLEMVQRLDEETP